MLSFRSRFADSTFTTMKNEVIALSAVLYVMDRGERFDIEFVTADRKKGTGGELKTMTNCVLYSAYKKDRPVDIKVEAAAVLSKNPRHFQNSTRNIYCMHSRETRKVHLRLITRFNGKQVL